MDIPFLSAIIGVGLGTIGGAAVVGYLLQKGCGVALLTVAAAVATGLCLLGAAVGGWPGLLVAILCVGALAGLVGARLGGKRGALSISSIWLGFSASCAIGFWIGGGIGLIAVTLPANLLFWATLYVLSSFLLPLRDDSQGKQALRSLLTFSLGTNYPYFVMHDRELEKRVNGNPYKAFLGGPGIILTGCDHLVAITDGNQIKTTAGPGLTFTERFEVVQSAVDLRPQLRAFTVDARTVDGIAIHVLTFVAFRIEWGGREPALGESYPFDPQAVLRALTNEVVEQDHKCNWDDLVEIQAIRIMRDIISRYKFDEFCLAVGPVDTGPGDILLRYEPDQEPAPHDIDQEPRYRIRDELVSRLQREIKVYGIDVLGGGISNLSPADRRVTEQRIKNWQTKWQARIDLARAEGEARKARLVEPAKIQVEHDLLQVVTRMLGERSESGAQMTDELLAATFVASLEQMAQNPTIKERLSTDVRRRLSYLHFREGPGQGSGASGQGHGG